ncbi:MULTISPECIES: DUF599 domain-containing protein [unclassified Arsukibacterium]|uniref:DUF599 domain-containing protein n=1 Tax=unclassified Arsukibacterium TaxID=2635278 RepID=UPI000C4A1655|nr:MULTISPECIES: DUF599 family protein [unclassified Arsukibacterium]MAA94325.1 hypothetical protein [Rheinheimera sp.]MBM34912.1 hypothetical protein [Rheinheimera sp.]HAW94572.1 DUF599 domain-containing protein [Candidatus Azambacteria bacterium]|tara:strand:- start:66271 stop:66948 length:678 start_codon:yes stop_codon:yes gene_type:complete
MPGPLDLIAVIWFFILWIGYTLFAKRKAKKVSCLSFELRRKRTDWMQKMLTRDNKMADVGLISTLERNVTFFASSSLLILAGLLTAMSSAEKLSVMLSNLVPWANYTEGSVQLKLLLMTFIFVFAFFQFTWSLRQYGFCGVLIGAAPDGRNLNEEDQALYANRAAKVIDQAGHSFNYGLRSIYFSLSALSWFIDPVLFMITSVVVMIVMKQREFHSKVLKALQEC